MKDREGKKGIAHATKFYAVTKSPEMDRAFLLLLLLPNRDDAEELLRAYNTEYPMPSETASIGGAGYHRDNSHFVGKWHAAQHASISANAFGSRDQAIARANMIDVFRNSDACPDPRPPSGASASRGGDHSQDPTTPPRVRDIAAASSVATPRKREAGPPEAKRASEKASTTPPPPAFEQPAGRHDATPNIRRRDAREATYGARVCI